MYPLLETDALYLCNSTKVSPLETGYNIDAGLLLTLTLLVERKGTIRFVHFLDRLPFCTLYILSGV